MVSREAQRPEAIAITWRIRLVKPKRFLYFADIIDDPVVPAPNGKGTGMTDAGMTFVVLSSRELAEQAVFSYLEEFKSAKLPQPEVEIVPFDQWGREI